MLLMVGICYSIHQYAKANNIYIKDYDKNKESSYLKYYDVNNLYRWTISQNLPVNNFKWVKDNSKFHESFIKIYNEERDKGYFLEVDGQYPEKLHDFHNDLQFLPEKMQIENNEKLVANLHDKTEYVIHIKNLKEGLNH